MGAEESVDRHQYSPHQDDHRHGRRNAGRLAGTGRVAGVPSVAQGALEDSAELRGHDESVHQLARLREVRAAERSAVGEPEREPVARLAEGVRARRVQRSPPTLAHGLRQPWKRGPSNARLLNVDSAFALLVTRVAIELLELSFQDLFEPRRSSASDGTSRRGGRSALAPVVEPARRRRDRRPGGPSRPPAPAASGTSR